MSVNAKNTFCRVLLVSTVMVLSFCEAAFPETSGWGAAPNPFVLPGGMMSGDTFPIFRDGAWHLFHMQLAGKSRLAHQVSRDLLHWRPRLVVAEPGPAGAPDSGGLATGCVVEHDGGFYCFYTGNQNVCLARSDDLDHWTKYENNPVARGDNRRYETANFRDPFVFRDDAEDCWWMVLATRWVSQKPPRRRAGCVGLAKSKDLLHWEPADPLWAPNTGPHCECPQVFRHDNRWYLTYLERDARYRVADSLEGPWRRTSLRDLGTLTASADSRPAFDGRRWISFPWVCQADRPDDLAGRKYGGPLAVPRRWEFHEDGSITQRVPDEILATMHAAARGRREPLQNAKTLAGRWDCPDGRTAESARPEGGALLLTSTPQDFYFEADLVLARDAMDAKLLFGVDDALEHGYQLLLRPSLDLVQLREITYWDTSRVLETVSVPLEKDRPIKLRVFRSGTIVEAFIDDRAVLTHRLFRHHDGSLALEFRDGPGAFRDILLCRLEPTPSSPH